MCMFLAVPDTPHIDVAKCSRSTSSVVLVLDGPSQDNDVVDGYRVFYSTDQDRPVDVWVCAVASYVSRTTHLDIKTSRQWQHMSGQ